MSATKLSAGLVLAATSGLLLITMTGTGFARNPGGHGPVEPPCNSSCQTNKAGNPHPVVTNGPAAKGGVGNTTGSKGLRQK
jgi:hypothetical protein